MGSIMLELSGVEYSYEVGAYVAIFADGDTVVLDASNLSEAEKEARAIVDATNDEMAYLVAMDDLGLLD